MADTRAPGRSSALRSSAKAIRQEALGRAPDPVAGTAISISVQEALAVEVWGVILAHNHPSGAVQPSEADVALTRSLKAALASVDIEVVDHLVVTADAVASVAAAKSRKGRRFAGPSGEPAVRFGDRLP